MNTSGGDLLVLTARIVGSYVRRCSLSPAEISELFQAVHAALRNAANPNRVLPPTPAVPIHLSVSHEYIVCLEDGRRLKTLKRHLWTAYGMSLAEYRSKWNLSDDYPMVAPSYAAEKAAFAKRVGLGRRHHLRPLAATSKP